MAVSCTIVLGTGGTAWAASAGEGRGYALEVKAGVSLVDLGLDIPLVDTGLQSAPPAFNVSGKMLAADIGGATNSLISLKAGVLSASTGSSLAQNRVETTAGISDINLSIAGVVAIKADVLQSQVQATCVNGAVQPTGAATIANLSISVLGIPVPIPLNPSPNTGLNTGILEIVFNEQTPVDGGMEVNALRIGAKIPTLADVNLVLGHSQASLADCTAAQGDTTPPAVDITTSPVINAGNQEAYIVAGSCTAGDGNVKVTIGKAPKFVTMTTACNAAGAWTAPAANVASLPLGPVDITATQTDAAGNTGTRSVITTKTTAAATDTTAPVVAVDNAAAINAGNEHGYTVSGTCTAGDGDVRVRIGTAPNSVEAVAACGSNGQWTTAATDLGGLPAGTVPIQASQTDAAGNTGTANVSVPKADTTLPVVTVGTPPQINAGNQGGYILSGTCTAGGGSVTVTIGTAPKAVVVTVPCDGNGHWTTPATDVSGLPKGSVTITVTQIQATGDVDSSTATTTKTTPGADDVPGSDSVAAIPVGGAWASLLLLGAAALGLRRRGRQAGPQRSGRHHD